MSPPQPEPTDLVCTTCASTFTTTLSHFIGLPIQQWWDERGRRCKNCVEPGPPLDHRTLPEQFLTFHEKHQHIYQALFEEGRVLIIRGHTTIGMKMLFERLRWQAMEDPDEPDLKLPNDFAPYYARLLMDQEPLFAGVFTLAPLRSHRGQR